MVSAKVSWQQGFEKKLLENSELPPPIRNYTFVRYLLICVKMAIFDLRYNNCHNLLKKINMLKMLIYR